jgi:hypothetical protein
MRCDDDDAGLDADTLCEILQHPRLADAAGAADLEIPALLKR